MLKTRTLATGHIAATRRARKAAFGSFVGAVVDWHDFLLYGIAAALVFNTQFFPNASPTIGTLAAFATFGVGFLLTEAIAALDALGVFTLFEIRDPALRAFVAQQR